MKRKKERRKPIICPYCKTVMVMMNRFEQISSLTKGIHAWYICARRKGEKGCGYSALFQVDGKTLLPQKPVFAVKIKKVRKPKEKSR